MGARVPVCPPSCQLTRRHGWALSTSSRTDVLILTPWPAPMVWKGTFNIDILNVQFRLQSAAVGLTVFANREYLGDRRGTSSVPESGTQ